MEVISLLCPNCGAPVAAKDKECEHCGSPIIITSMKSAASLSTLQLNKYANSYRKTLENNPDNRDINLSIGICYLKLKLYDKALPAFEKAMEDNFENPEPFYLAAMALLKGKKPFVTPRADIDKMIEYLNAAIMIDPQAIFYYFLAYIKYDYFERKYLNTKPNYHELIEEALAHQISPYDVDEFHAQTDTPSPQLI